MTDANAKSKMTVIFSCSGAADVGEIADGAARRLSREGVGRMACLSGIGARHEGHMKLAGNAENILVLDGCPHACASRMLADAGFTDIAALCLADLGLQKHKSPADAARIDQTASQAKALLGR